MALKSKAKPNLKSKAKVKAKANIKLKAAVKAKSAGKQTSKPKAKAKILKKPTSKAGVKASSESVLKTRVRAQAIVEKKPDKILARPAAGMRPAPVVKRMVAPLVDRRKPTKKRSLRINQFAFMKAPGLDHGFDVGDAVEVFCDHEKSRERIRGWIKGIVVQVDNKMVAVQFRSNVYLTDGWMVPDRILWYPLSSEHIRAVPGKKLAIKRDLIPDY